MKTLSLRPYPGFILLFDDFKAFKRKYLKAYGMKHELDPQVLGTTATIAHSNGGRSYLVYAKRRANRRATLVHEINHVALMVFEYIGTHPGSGNGEPFCYLVDHLLEQATA